MDIDVAGPGLGARTWCLRPRYANSSGAAAQCDFFLFEERATLRGVIIQKTSSLSWLLTSQRYILRPGLWIARG